MTDGKTVAANAEANLYGILAEVLAFPNKELANVVESGLLQMTVDLVSRDFPCEVNLPLSALGPAGFSPTVLEAEYIRLFDVPDRAPTPLYTGVYASRRRDAMEELLRIYRHFGVTVNGDSHDLPDFVPTVLEFLQFLAQGMALTMDSAREPRERAMADVLERHLCPWAAQTSVRLEKREALPFYRALVDAVDALGSARLRQLRGRYPSTSSNLVTAAYRPSR